MAPILDGPRVTAADQHAVAITTAGVTLLQTVFPNQSPLLCLTKIATSQPLLRDATISTTAFADWLFTDSAGLEQLITATAGEGIEWTRAIFGSTNQEQILVSWIEKDPAFKQAADTAARVWGLIILAVGAWFLVDVTLGYDMPSIPWGDVWPVGLILIGLVVILRGMGRRTA